MGRCVVVVAYDGAELLDIACVTTSLAMANELAADPGAELAAEPGAGSRVDPEYLVTVASPGGSPVACQSGLTLAGQSALERLTGPLDTLIVSGGLGHRRAAGDRRLVGHVRRLARVSRRVASVCTGASILAAAGLLDGRRATTHWRFADRLAADHPAVTVDPDPIYIRDGNLTTAAGVTSALDLALAFIEEDCGGALARQVARHLVTYLHRPGNQAQMSVFTSAPAVGGVLRRVVDHVVGHPAGDLSTAALAALAGVSQRHLTRLFVEQLGRTPGRFVWLARTEAAARLLATTPLPLPGVAARCGFGSAETLRRAFTRRYGIPPARYRQIQTEMSVG